MVFMKKFYFLSLVAISLWIAGCKSASKLYEKCGFRKIGDTTAEEWYGTPGLSMEKILDIEHKQNAAGS